MQLVLSTLSMEGCAKVAGILIAKKKEVNHADTENTEAKQKEGFHFRKKSFTQRRGDAKKRRKEEKVLSKLNGQFELQFIAGDAGNSLRLRAFARVFSPWSLRLCG